MRKLITIFTILFLFCESDMVCNDPDKNEENLFTEDERKQISSVIGYEELNDSINKILKLQEVGTKLQETFNNIDLND